VPERLRPDGSWLLPSMTALALEQVTIQYSSGGYDLRPIEELDLHVDSGELVLLLGRSGCGKTSLLSAVAGILSPSAGTIRVGDTEVTSLRGRRLTEYRRHTVGIVFQAFNLVPSLTAFENVQVPVRAGGAGARRARARAAELLEQLGLADRMHHRPGDLSGGQQQRVAIARAVALDPLILLADEPTAHLDYIQVEGVLTLLRQVATPGRIVLVATHDERLLPLADRVVELSPQRPAAAPQPPRRQTLVAGEVLFRQGDPGDVVYVVEAGMIDLTRRLASGGEERLMRTGAGDYFGELAPIFGLPRSATARAFGPATVTAYNLEDFRELVRERDDINVARWYKTPTRGRGRARSANRAQVHDVPLAAPGDERRDEQGV
jgi:putative ABC transport system ATP-binding protein